MYCWVTGSVEANDLLSILLTVHNHALRIVTIYMYRSALCLVTIYRSALCIVTIYSSALCIVTIYSSALCIVTIYGSALCIVTIILYRSGSSANLEMAVQLAGLDTTPKNQVCIIYGKFLAYNYRDTVHH